MHVLDLLAARRLIVVTGKGGVGKTTLTAVLGRLLGARGRHVLLLEVDPRESLHQALGTEPSGGEIIHAGAGLWTQNLQPQAVIEELVRAKVSIPFLAGKITRSAAFRHFTDGAPGLKETAVLGHAYRILLGRHHPPIDTVVIDAPATGHGAAMLAAPALLAQASAGGQLGDLAAELAGFLADPRASSTVIATLAEEMPVQETLELLSLLGERGRVAPELVVANALYPPIPEGSDPGGLPDLWTRRRRMNERELERLKRAWPGPLVELPNLPLDRGPELVAALAQRLAEARP